MASSRSRSHPKHGGLLWLLILVDSWLGSHSSRAYPLGCSREDSSYYDYDNYPFPPPGVPVKSTTDYNIIERLGNGKFSDVFSAIEVNQDQEQRNTGREIMDDRSLVVIKCLKPVTDRKIRRELLVLSHASKLPNLARLKAVVLHPEFYASQRDPGKLPRMPSFVLEHAGTNTQFLCHPKTTIAGREEYLSDYEIRYFLYHLLIALDALHSKGMMHRDVKPRNILIRRDDRMKNVGGDKEEDSTTRTTTSRMSSLMLIDLGLADFYLPNTRYNVRVASRHYKAPELLIGYQYYSYGVDLWPVGCMLAGALFRREPFFRGKDNQDQLRKIIGVLGTSDLLAYMNAYGIPAVLGTDVGGSGGDGTTATTTNGGIGRLIGEEMARERSMGQNGGRVAWASFLRAGCPYPSADALDLLDKLLVYDHNVRLTAEEAMAHPFFDRVRDRVIREVAAREEEEQAQC